MVKVKNMRCDSSNENKGARSKRMYCIIVLLFFVCVFLYSVSVSAKKEELSAKYVKQQKTNWCWAASAENSVRYERKIKRTQKDAVKKLKGWLLNPHPNIGGNAKDIKEAAEYISSGKENYSYLNKQETFNFLKRQVHIKNVPIIIYDYYKGKQKTTRHAVAVIGYNDANDSIRVYDSDDGQKHWYDYKTLCNGKIKINKLNAKYSSTIFNLDR